MLPILGCYPKGNARIMLGVMIRPISVLCAKSLSPIKPIERVHYSKRNSISPFPWDAFLSGIKKGAYNITHGAQICAGGYACSGASSMIKQRQFLQHDALAFPTQDKPNKPIARTLISFVPIIMIPQPPVLSKRWNTRVFISPFLLAAGLGPCRQLLLLVLFARTEIKER